MSVPDEKGVYPSVPLYDRADTLHPDPVAGAVGYGNSVFKPYRFLTGIFDLQKDFSVPFVKLHVDHTGHPLCGNRPAGVDRILQRIGQNHAQVTVRHREKGGQRTLHPDGDFVFLGPGHEGRYDQIGRFVFAVAPYLLGLEFLTDTGDIGPGLLRLSILNTGGHVLQMMPQIMAVSLLVDQLLADKAAATMRAALMESTPIWW